MLRKSLPMMGLNEVDSCTDQPRWPSWWNFPVLVLQVELEMKDRFRLPPFAGSMFRGVLGWALKEVCSPALYSYLFETSSQQSGHHDAVRPFLLVPPADARDVSRGKRLTVDLRLFGQGCDYLPEFTEALMLAGDRGLGSRNARFELTKIVVQDGQRRWVAFDAAAGWAQAYLPLPSALGAFAVSTPDSPRAIAIDFETPTRLISEGQPVTEPDFESLFRALYRRLRCLLEFHTDLPALPSLADSLAELAAVKGFHRVEWVDWERKSNRQGRRHIMGGLVGQSLYSGHFHPEWVRLLKAGEILHVGKAATFGMGGYRLSFPSAD